MYVKMIENIQVLLKMRMVGVFIYSFMFVNIISCVGTISTLDPTSTKSSVSTDITIQAYEGIRAANAVSNNRAEIFFPPIPGVTDNIVYVIRYDGIQIPIYVFANSILPNYKGLLKYTVSGLATNSNYSFTVQVRNILTNVESNNAEIKKIKTYSNLAANFGGITEVRNLAGSDGLTGIKVVWEEGEKKGTDFMPNEIDPDYYQITVIDSNMLNPGNMNDTTFGEINGRKTISVPSGRRTADFFGLKSNTKYFVQVRCISKGKASHASDVNYLNEQNTDYLEITTYSDYVANINFDDSSFKTSYPVGTAGLTSVGIKWSIPTGNFDHYRVFFAKDGTTDLNNYLNSATYDIGCSGTETADTNISCVPFPYTIYNSSIGGLAQNTIYDFQLVLCLDTACSPSKRRVVPLVKHTTTPPLANFSGIDSISLPSSASALDKLYLNFTPPNLLTGNTDGLVVEYLGSDPNAGVIIALNDPAQLNTSVLSVSNFDYRNDSFIEINGVDPSSIVPYCFNIVPYTLDNTGQKVFSRSGLSVVCKIPGIVTPQAASGDFVGITTGLSNCDSTDKTISLVWDTPTRGIFSHYELFVKVDGAFSFTDATTDSTNSYYRILIPSTENSYVINNLTGTHNYKLGLLTYFYLNGQAYRSEFNSNILSCF